jgi:very-short-patch-repair endonuclease
MRPDKINNYGYNPRLRVYANALRRDMTKSEACLWKFALRAGKMKGYQFRRQRPVLEYIADFMCQPLKLIIEADGFSHQSAEQVARDKERDRVLKAAGFRILRFTDTEILKDINNVIRTIETVIDEISSSQDTPSSTPYPRQRGTA